MMEKLTDGQTKERMKQLIIKLDHKSKACWAADCAKRVLPLFEGGYPDDDRPRKAIKAALAWAMGRLDMADVQKYVLAAYEAARETGQTAGAAARAAGHAAATAQFADHAPHAAAYAAKAAAFASDEADTKAAAREREWQLERLMQYSREKNDGNI